MKFLKKVKLRPILLKFILPLFCGFAGALLGILAMKNIPETQNDRIKNFYEDEMSTLVSPTTLKKMIDTKDDSYILVDLRSAAEYNSEHFITAVNIPAVSMNTDQIVSAFRALPKDKQIIIHCYSAYCTLGRQVGQTLAEHGVFVKELDAGWSELRYHWDLWNPGAKVTDGASYIVHGAPSSDKSTLPAPCVAGKYGC